MKFSESDTWDDNEIIRVVESSPYLPGSDESLVQISNDTVVKFGHTFTSSCSEALAMDLVRTQTSILVPRPKRVIHHMHDEGNGLIVMEFIRNGRQLHVCWPTLSLWAKLKIILTMRRYLRQLPRIQDPRSTTPGPLASQPSVCNGLQFGYDPQGPFSTMTALAEYFHKLHHFSQYRSGQGYTPLPPLNENFFTRLVFTHNDLNMRNILLDDCGRLWIIDWGFAGFFPPCFEYLGMRYAAQKDKEPKGWQTAIKFMAEPYFEMEEWMTRIGMDYTR
jgi:hypothetical protein